MPIDLKSFYLDDQEPPAVLRTARKPKTALGRPPYVPKMRLDWFLLASYAVTGEAQLRFVVLLYRQWVMSGKDVVAATAKLAGTGHHGGARRVTRAALAALVRAGLIEIIDPGKQSVAPRVRLLFPQFEVPKELVYAPK
jgi:hypothetical protein